MRTGFSSKHSKKNSDEERSKKKKMRSTKRRRHDSSSSSYSSGSEIDARSRKKRNQREPKKPEKMRKESNKAVKKKSRKTRYRRDASVSSSGSYSSRSCSTCRGRSSSSGGSESDYGRSRSHARGNKKGKLRERIRSRSPPRADRKAKLTGRSRSSSPPGRADRKVKSRDRSRSKGRERGRSRRSLRRMSSKRDGGRYLSRSCSSCERRSRSSRSYSQNLSYGEGKGKEVDQPKRLKSARVVTKESEEMELGGKSYSESQSEGKGKEVDQPRRLKSALVATKESEEMEGIRGRDKIIQGYDDLGRSFDAYEKASDDRQVELGGEKHATDTWVEDTAYAKGDKYVLTKINTEPAKNADFGNYDSTRKNSGDAVNAGSSEPKDLELLLRQKALENFRKFRGGFLAQKGTSGDRKDESVQNEPCKDAGGFVEAKDTIVSSNCKSTSSLERQGSVQGGIPMTQPRIRSIVNIPTENGDGNSIICCQNASESSRPAVDPIITSVADAQTTPNHLKSKEEPLDKDSLGKTLSAKDIQNKKSVAEPGSSGTTGDEVKIADGSASGASACLNVKNGNKLAEENTTGSHFEQKTLSRMHDGEMVQVSYKVYIPKKGPALARRQLQR